jgi:hypothetical protein
MRLKTGNLIIFGGGWGGGPLCSFKKWRGGGRVEEHKTMCIIALL